jgi:hypothetical protein
MKTESELKVYEVNGAVRSRAKTTAEALRALHIAWDELLLEIKEIAHPKLEPLLRWVVGRLPYKKEEIDK